MRVLLCIILLWQPTIDANQLGFEEGKHFGQGGVALGNPDSLTGDTGFLAHRGDVSALSNLDDDALRQKAREVQSEHLHMQDGSDLLSNSDNAKIDALNEHQINPQNSFYKASETLQQNPLSTVQVTAIKQGQTVRQSTLKTCTEGVEFELAIERQLIFTPPPRQPQQVDMSIYFHGCVHAVQHSRKVSAGLFGWSSKTVRWATDEPNIAAINTHVEPYFTPKDIVTNHVHNLKKERIHKVTFLAMVPNHTNYCPLGPGFVGGNGWLANLFVPKYLVRVRYHHDTYQSEAGSKEHWDIITRNSEAILENNDCYESRRQCLESGIRQFDELAINRPCWREKIFFTCGSGGLEGCKHLKDKGCELKESHCLDNNKPCLKWRRTYNCVFEKQVMGAGFEGSSVYCLDGSCYTPELEQNTDMMEAVSHLAVMQEMKKGMTTTNPPTVFRGDNHGCQRYMLDFVNCCTSMKGWGKSLGLHQCRAEEKVLAKKRKKELCHYVGTYCVARVPLIGNCIRKKQSYCCFGTKLARIFHEQGRPQIGRGWGSAKHSDCGPLTADEIKRMRFDQMNFSELFSDMFKGVDKKASKNFPKQMQNQMPTMQQTMQKGERGVTKQVF